MYVNAALDLKNCLNCRAKEAKLLEPNAEVELVKALL